MLFGKDSSGADVGAVGEDPPREKKEKKKKAKEKEKADKKERKEKNEKKERASPEAESSRSSEEVALDGSRARLAAKKSLEPSLQALAWTPRRRSDERFH